MELTAFAGWLNSAFAVYDSTILKLMHSLAESLGSILTPIMKVITLLGEKGLILILLSIALMLFTRTRRVGVCMFGAIACGAILTNFVLKDLVARPRPFESLTVYRQWWEFLGAPAEDGFSFPSGHVTAATAGMTALCLTRGRKWVIPSVLWVLLMAVSRNYLMAHFPSDVLFAVVIGLIAALIAYAITEKLRRHGDEEEDVELEEDEDDDYTIRYNDEPVDKIDVSEAFDEIVRDKEAAKAVEEEEDEAPAFLPRFKRSSESGYQGKHAR